MRTIPVCLSMALALAACGKSDDDYSSSSDDGDSAASSGGSSGQEPWEDHSKPYLTDKKMGDFVASLGDHKNPFKVFTKGVTPFNAESKVAEFESYAKAHGFESGAEYMGAWLRIMAVHTQAMMEESNATMVKAQEEAARNAEEALKKPDLTPEMRQMYAQQAQGARDAIKAYQQPREGGMNRQDIETYKKHRTDFEAALKAMQ